MKIGHQTQEVWEDGYAWKDLENKSFELITRKEELEARRRKLQSLKRIAKKNTSPLTADDADDNDIDLIAEAEAIKSHLEQLKRDETALAEQRRLLEAEKAAHQKELRRCQSEDRSRFYNDLPCLAERYLFLSLLGHQMIPCALSVLMMFDIRAWWIF
jgi:tousled-like kinase